LEKDDVNLIFSYTGYGRKEEVISKKSFLDKGEITIEVILESQDFMEVFAVKRSPLHKRVWNGIKNVFRKK
jgi:hypothetical protein